MTFWTEPAHLLRPPCAIARHSRRRLRRDFERALARLRELAEGGEAADRVEVAGGDRLPAFVR